VALTMIVLAGGMGSRFGGPKQLVPLGPSGETILDYNAHDAAAAGFDRIVVVTRPELEAAVAAVIAAGVGRVADTRLALQRIPAGRTKPLGTADAVVAAAPHVDGAFGVANADDLYGPGSFQVLLDHLRAAPDIAAVVGFPLDDTVPSVGAVSRALLDVDDHDEVRRVIEVHGIERVAGGGWRPEEVAGFGPLTPDVRISMNLWGLPSSAMGAFADVVTAFVASGADGEVYLPTEVSALLAAGRLRVTMLRSDERWSGLTNPDDVAAARTHAASRWPAPLWS
jgi:NDP-sugar pyrophosphorylase family protein